MDINEYIESGVLELYVAGALSSEEAREVEEMSARYPEIRHELDDISATVETLLRGGGRNPAPQLRPMILESINGLQTDASVTPEIASPAPIRRYLLAASVSVAILASGVAGYLSYRLGEVNQELAALRDDNLLMAQENRSLKADNKATSQDIAFLVNPDKRSVEMKGTPGAPDARAVVYWDQRSKQVRLDRGTLPPPPEGKQYQLWAIAGKDPVDAGVVKNDPSHVGLFHMKDVASADAFAVTLEKEGGSPTPTLDAMMVIGTL